MSIEKAKEALQQLAAEIHMEAPKINVFTRKEDGRVTGELRGHVWRGHRGFNAVGRNPAEVVGRIRRDVEAMKRRLRV